MTQNFGTTSFYSPNCNIQSDNDAWIIWCFELLRNIKSKNWQK